jgi:hypothetical protein
MGATGASIKGAVNWCDFDTDGDLDILANGFTGTTSELRIYKSSASLGVANTAPTAPITLAATWAYTASGISTATFKWNAGVDNATGATAENGLTYQLEVSTTSGFTGKSTVAGQWTSPGMGNYLKPPKIFDGNTNHGVMLRNLPQTNTTYYYRVKTVDAGLKESGWSATGSVYTLVASSEPSAVTDLGTVDGNGQITLMWTAPLNIQSGAGANYDVRYSTVGAITDNTSFSNATQMTGEPTPGPTGTSEQMWVTGLTPGWRYYFGIKSVNDNGTSVLDVSSPRANSVANYFDMTQIEVDGANGGVIQTEVRWGDFDNDGDLDILSGGATSAGTYELRIYKNNGNGTIDGAQIEVDGANGGMYYGGVGWGDFDNDGDLDILASGYATGNTKELRVYKNNGNGTINATQIEVDGANGGLWYSGVDWGDFDNDGDLDVLASGYTTGSTRELRIYKNNGNGTIDGAQIEVDGANGGLYYSSIEWGDFDNDGDLDILANGLASGTRELRVYKNNGNGTMDATQIEVDGANGGLITGGVGWGDFDNDGDLDILASGLTSGNTKELRVYLNNGNGTIDGAQIEVDGANEGYRYGKGCWGDFDNDGDLDILASGETASTTYELRVYKNNGNATINSTPIDLEGANGGLTYSSVGWGDFDSDGDIDALASGGPIGVTRELRIYKNMMASVQANTSPNAPGTLTGGFAFSSSSVATAPAPRRKTC